MIFYILISLVLSLIQVHSQKVCTPTSCRVTSVVLNSTTISGRNPPYACRGEQLVFNCQVMNVVSLQWASEPDILCSNAISYTAGDDEGERRTRNDGSYQSYLVSVARDPPNSNFTSNLTFTPPESVNNVTVVCGNQLSFCSSTEAERTVRITDVPMVPQESLQYFIRSQESCPSISVLIQIAEIEDIATLTYELTVSSAAGCALQECPMLLNPGQRILTLVLLNGTDYNATLEVSNDCGSNSTTILIQEECEVRPTGLPGTPGIVRVEVTDVRTIAGAVAGGVAGGVAVAAISILVVVVCYKNMKIKQEKKLRIFEAVGQGDIEEFDLKEVREVMKKRDDAGRTILHIAARGKVGMRKVLIAHGVKKRLAESVWRKLLKRAAGIEIVKRLVSEETDVNIQDKFGMTPLHLAAREGHEETVRFLIEKGAQINIQDENGMTPLHLAAREGHEETVKFLIEKGAQINIQDECGWDRPHIVSDGDPEEEAIINSRDKEGRTPLHIAARESHDRTVEFLIKKGAQINIKDNEGQTPLHSAAREGNTPIIELLFDCKADLNIQDKDGRTPLHIAAGEGHKITVEFLIEKRAQINIQDNEGMTPLDVAKKSRRMEIVKHFPSSDWQGL